MPVMPKNPSVNPPADWGEPVANWRIQESLDRRYISWRPGYALPCAWVATLESEQEPYIIKLDMAADEHGPECLAVHFIRKGGDDAQPITASALRPLRVGEYIELAITSAAKPEQFDGKVRRMDFGGDRDLTERARFAAQSGSDEHLRMVAAIYSAAESKPTQAVEQAYPYSSRSTIGRWLKDCRDRGFLPRTTRGRATPGRKDM